HGARRTPAAHERARALVLRLGRVGVVPVRQVDMHDVVRTTCTQVLPIGVADNVVRWSRQPVERAGHGGIEAETVERSDAWHPPCIAGATPPARRTSCTRAAERCSRTVTRTPRRSSW